MLNKKNILLGIAVLLLLNGCTSTKKLEERMEKFEARLAVIEKMLLPPEEEKQKEAYDVPVGDSYVFGDKDAPVTITVFSNFQCPYCSFADKALREVVQDPKLKSKVKLVFKHFPFERHVNARAASKAAFAAGEQGKFWEMAEKIFANQEAMSDPAKAKEWATIWPKKFAQELKLDIAKFEEALKVNDKKYDEMINKDIEMGAKKAELKGTPWILVGGWRYEEEKIDVPSIEKVLKEHNLL